MADPLLKLISKLEEEIQDPDEGMLILSSLSFTYIIISIFISNF